MNALIGNWNYYFLRYAVGTVFGAVIVVFLSNQGDVSGKCYVELLLLKLGAGELAPITALAALGFAYCYIASAPGVVFHAARGLFWSKTQKKCLRRYWYFILICLCLCPLPFVNHSHPLYIWGAIIVVWIIYLHQIFLLVATFCNREEIQIFYKDLTNKRSRNENNIQNYRKSYRDLREHSNAFEIIFLELILAATIIFFKDFFPLLIALWVLPAALCWLIGTRLEFNIPEEIPDSPVYKKVEAKKPTESEPK